MKITLNGKEVDLDKALPITMGDLRQLKKLGINYPSTFDARDPDHVILFLNHFCKKVAPEVTEGDVESMSLEEALTAMHSLMKTKEVIDRPISGESTASPTTTAGAPAI